MACPYQTHLDCRHHQELEQAVALATRNNLLQTVLNKLLIMRETARANLPTAGWKVNRREVTVTRANGRQVIKGYLRTLAALMPMAAKTMRQLAAMTRLMVQIRP